MISGDYENIKKFLFYSQEQENIKKGILLNEEKLLVTKFYMYKKLSLEESQCFISEYKDLSR